MMYETKWEKFCNFIGFVILWAFVALFAFCCYKCGSELNKADTERLERLAVCRQKHDNKPFVEEKLYATTADGCRITELTKYSAECYEEDRPLYVSNCRGSTSWEVGCGKGCRRTESTQTESK